MTKKILFWLGVCIVSLLVMVRPAAAVSWKYNSVGASFTTPALACASYAVPYNPVTGTGNSWTFLYATMVTSTNYSCYYNNYLGVPTGAFGAAVDVDAVVCPVANTLHSSGFFNIGTTATGSALASACQGGCAIKTVGSTAAPGQSLYIAAPPKIRQIRNGVWYYFAEMSYYHTGVNCSPDTPNFLSDFVGTLPGMTCAAGQQMITMSGVTKCFNSDGSATNANSASAVAAAKTLADQKIASAVAAAGTAAQQAGLGASAVEAAKTAAAAGAIVSTGGTSSNPYSTSDPMFQYCVDNPDADLCQQKTACDKNPNLASCAELGTVADDVPLGTRTVSVTNITPVTVGGAGACPAPRAMVLHGQTYYMAFDTYCNFATGIKPIILVFAWLASAGLLVGGFKAA